MNTASVTPPNSPLKAYRNDPYNPRCAQKVLHVSASSDLDLSSSANSSDRSVSPSMADFFRPAIHEELRGLVDYYAFHSNLPPPPYIPLR